MMSIVPICEGGPVGFMAGIKLGGVVAVGGSILGNCPWVLYGLWIYPK